MYTRESRDLLNRITNELPDKINTIFVPNTECDCETMVDTIEFFKLLYPLKYPEYKIQSDGVSITIDCSTSGF